MEIKSTIYTKRISYAPHQYNIEYKNNQTTSTKCQYQAAHSNPTIWLFEFNILVNRTRDTVRNTEPIITCNPWNPVVMKKTLPNEESDIQKGASTYSKPWSIVKIAPSMIVMIKDVEDLEKFFFSISWWDQVTVTPEDKSKIVFIRGILIGLKVTIDKEGQFCPNSIVGEILLWKKAQKKDTKKRTSDKINSTIPIFNPFITSRECIPW